MSRWGAEHREEEQRRAGGAVAPRGLGLTKDNGQYADGEQVFSVPARGLLKGRGCRSRALGLSAGGRT